ncbi:MAG: GDSL-type esterase/lipase family protein [Candidatus Phaeomarinobacter sp.]
MSLNRVDDRESRGWRRGAIRVAAIVSALVVVVFAFLVYVLLASSDPVYWAGEIAEFERLDISNPPDKGQIVFAGGGTIRQWENLERALAPLPVIQRGFGGAHVAHVTAYAPRIIQPYDPIAVVISAGADDLADVGGKPPDQVEADMAALIALLRPAGLAARDEPQVYILSITPSPMRAARWPAFAQANKQLRALAETNPGVHFVDVASLIATDEGQMDEALFRWDGLTFNEDGYGVIGRAIRQRLMADLGATLRSAPPPTVDPLNQPVPAP